MSRLVIIRGNSGSGKSTIARRLQHELGYGTMLIPQDVIRREIIRTKDVPENPAIQLIKDIVIYGRSIGYDVIIEGILFSKIYGEMLREIAELFEDIHVYYLDISFEETLRRHRTKSNAHEFGEEQMREWYVESDALELPNERLIDETQSQDAIVRSIIRDVRPK